MPRVSPGPAPLPPVRWLPNSAIARTPARRKPQAPLLYSTPYPILFNSHTTINVGIVGEPLASQQQYCSLCGADHRLLWSATLIAKRADDINRSSVPPGSK